MKHQPLLQLLFAFSTIIVLAACNRTTVAKNEAGESAVYNVASDDPEMIDAIAKANQTLDKFNEAFQSGNTNYNNMALKAKFAAGENSGGEHLWISIIDLKDGKYTGIVNNTPELTSEVKLGDTIVVNNKNITDWMYSDKGRLRGGYTMRLIRNRMTVEERKQFDAESGLIIAEGNE